MKPFCAVYIKMQDFGAVFMNGKSKQHLHALTPYGLGGPLQGNSYSIARTGRRCDLSRLGDDNYYLATNGRLCVVCSFQRSSAEAANRAITIAV